MPLRALCPNAIKCHLSWRKKKFAEPEGPANFLVDKVIFFAAEAWERRAYATCNRLADIVTTLGYDLENIYLRSSVAQNISFHNAFEI